MAAPRRPPMAVADWARADQRALVAVLRRAAERGGAAADRVAIAFNAGSAGGRRELARRAARLRVAARRSTPRRPTDCRSTRGRSPAARRSSPRARWWCWSKQPQARAARRRARRRRRDAARSPRGGGGHRARMARRVGPPPRGVARHHACAARGDGPRRRARPPRPGSGSRTLAAAGERAAPCAPGRCHLPAELRAGQRRFGLAAHLYALRRRGDQGIGDFTTLRGSPRRPRARAASPSASIRCTRCSATSASGRAPTIRPTGGFSIRSTSTSTRRAGPRGLVAGPRAARRPAPMPSLRCRRARASTTRASGS